MILGTLSLRPDSSNTTNFFRFEIQTLKKIITNKILYVFLFNLVETYLYFIRGRNNFKKKIGLLKFEYYFIWMRCSLNALLFYTWYKLYFFIDLRIDCKNINAFVFCIVFINCYFIYFSLHLMMFHVYFLLCTFVVISSKVASWMFNIKLLADKYTLFCELAIYVRKME